MSSRKVLIFVTLVVILILVAPWLTTQAPVPIKSGAKVVADDIFQVIDRTKRLPAELALPQLARAGGAGFVRALPLDEDVKRRLLTRLNSAGFVHEIVPFVLAVKDMYLSPEAKQVRSFDTYLRQHFKSGDDIPGAEHSMFSWQVADEDESSGGFGIDLKLAGQLIEFYDALYLEDQNPNSDLATSLSCSQAQIQARLPASAARSGPALRQLLQSFRSSMAEGAELTTAVDNILTDDQLFETISLSLIQFIDQMVCKHYQMFASRVAREDQLLQWLTQELTEPDGGKVWSYLDKAQNKQRHGVLIAVDGLQGHLIQSLAQGQPDAAFVQVIAEEQKQGAIRLQSQADDVQVKLAQQTEFLNFFAESGFGHPQYLPFFSDLYSDTGESDSLKPWAVSRAGISTSPTISVRNLPVIKTGAPVAGVGATGIPNFHFVDRDYVRNGIQQGRAYYFYGNDVLQLSALAKQAGMQSLYERLPSVSSYNCAAQYDEWAQAGIDPLLNLALGEATRDFAEVLCFSELRQRALNENNLRQLRAELLELRESLTQPVAFYDWYRAWGARVAKRRAGQLVQQIAELQAHAMPELLIYYNPWPDHFAHFTGPFADEIIAPTGELNRLDYWLGELQKIYLTAGISERTLFGMAGDHGLAPVFQLESPEARVLAPMQARGVPLKMIKISSDEGEGPKLTHLLEPPSMRGYDVVVASTAGGNLMFDLFVNQTDRWEQQPLEADLRAWRPALWLNEKGLNESGLQKGRSTGKAIDFIAEILDGLGDTLDYLAVRHSHCDASECAVRILGPGGSGLITRQGDRIHYTFNGRDLLETDVLSRYDTFSQASQDRHNSLYQRCLVSANPSDASSWCSESEWRTLTATTPRQDSVAQMAHLYDLDRAGTVNLFPASGVAYNSIVPGRHAGESFHEKDAFAGLWGVPVKRNAAQGQLPATAGGSVPTAIFEYLTAQPVTPGEDGWGYPSLWNQLY